MCGITALVKKTDQFNLNLITQMSNIIAHRGPDYEDFSYHQNLALAHRRLSIIDLSELAHQPMHYLDRYVIVFNGEIYNYQEIKEELILNHYTFKSQSDTEVIMAAYDYWKEDCLHHFNGMWSFVLLDKVKNILFCARDRFGVKPFYYYAQDDYFAIASEIKQFSVLPNWKAKLNKQSAFDFLSWSFSDTGFDTFFENVFQLKGGHSLIYHLDNHEFKIKKWYSIQLMNLDSNNKSLKEKFLEIFQSSVNYRLIADVKVGSCLSGGLDSSSIVVMINKILREQGKHELQETVSAISSIKNYDESEFINQVIDSTECNAHFIEPVFDDFINDFDRMIWHQDEPIGSSSIFAQWKVFQKAKESGITVMLDGQGSDEIFGGYLQFYGNLLLSLISQGKIEQLIDEINALKNDHNITYTKISKYVMSVLSSGMLYNYAVNMSGKLASKWAFKDPEIIQFPSWKKLNNSISKESHEQLLYSKLPILLHNEDRNSMAFSIESRVPFLDYRLVEFALSLPDEKKINKGTTKYILREGMKDILPEKIVNRKDKMAFVTAEEVWIKNNKDFFINELNSLKSCTPTFIKPSAFEYFEKMINGLIPFDHSLMRFVSFGRWIKIFNVEI